MVKRLGGTAVVLAVGVCFVSLLLGGLMKDRCFDPWNGSPFCYSDIPVVYLDRGIKDDDFPYVNGVLIDSDPAPQLGHGAIEYPVLTGLFIWATALPVDSTDGYLRLSMFLLAPFALLVAFLLARLVERRALLWSAAPALLFYAFHNWDLLAVAAVVSGFYFWYRGKPVWTAVLFGVGAGLKVFPLLFLAPLALERLFARDRRGAAMVLGAGIGVVALVNLPFMLINIDGWFATYEFHSLRPPNIDNVWAVRPLGPIDLPHLGRDTLNWVTALLVGVFGAVALGFGWMRAQREGRYPVVEVSAALLAAFLLFNKVHSPQYALWILPFFALLRVPIAWWIAYAIADLAVYVGTFRFFYDICADNRCVPFADPNDSETLMNAGVYGRGFLLLMLFVVFLDARPVRTDPAPAVTGGPGVQPAPA